MILVSYETLEKLFYKDQKQYEEKYQSMLSSDSAYKLPINIHKYPAFFILTSEIFVMNYQIYQLANMLEILWNHKISKKNRYDTDYDIVKTKFLETTFLKELIATNEIAGIKSVQEDMVAAMAINLGKDNQLPFHGLVKKYQMLMENETIDVMSCSKIRILYDEIIESEFGDFKKPDGIIFRKDAIEIRDGAQIIHHGLAPESKMIEAMERAISILKDDDLPMIIRIAIFHYLVDYIHPFYDGNGHLNRLISSYLLKEEFHVLVAFGISTTIKKHQHYYNNMFEVTNNVINRGDLTFFITEFMKLVMDTIQTMHDNYRKSIQE